MNDSASQALAVDVEYEVRNDRKGTFRMRVTRIDGEWISGIITEGLANAMVFYNVRHVGEEVTVRACQSYFQLARPR